MAVFIVSFDNPQAGSRFIDYLNNMPDGKGINLFLSDHPAEVHKAGADLLAACKAALARLSNPLLDTSLFADVQQQLRAAIAKATGQPGA